MTQDDFTAFCVRNAIQIGLHPKRPTFDPREIAGFADEERAATKGDKQ
jgi:hypothetical protein